MKRLAWLLLAVFVTALAQVTPVELGAPEAKACSCCETPGECGQRDCGLPPSSGTSTTLLAEQPAAQTQATAKQKKAARIYRLAINYLLLPRELPVARISPVVSLESAERVPLFKAQCRFLI